MADVKLLSFEFSTPQQRHEYETTIAKWVEDGYQWSAPTAVEYPLNDILGRDTGQAVALDDHELQAPASSSPVFCVGLGAGRAALRLHATCRPGSEPRP